jgi:hypothetical protein
MIPEVNKQYHFFDDGKISSSRHYIATVLEIIPLNKAKKIIISTPRDYNWDTQENHFVDMSLYDIWRDEVAHIDWIFSDDTECIVKCAIPEYDDDPIYFAQDKRGGWFSMDVTNWWQGGRLDIDGKLYKILTEEGYER